MRRIAGDPVSSVELDDYRVLDDAVLDPGGSGLDATALHWVAQAERGRPMPRASG